MLRRRLLTTTLAAGTLAALRAPASAQEPASYPSRPLRMILTAPPGSSIDVLGRLLAEGLRERLGQPVIADNRPQAGGTAGTDAIAKAAPDGYTIGLSFTGPLATAPALYRRLPYDPARDLAPVIRVGTAPNILAVHAGLPVRSVAEFIALTRARPGQLNYASVGNGSASHLAMELLKKDGGLFIVHIPFNGAPPAAQAVAAGDVQAIMSNPTSLLPLIQAGKLRPLAVTGARRWSGDPGLPTIAESGFPGFEAVAWNGIVAPAAVPGAIVARLNAEIAALLRQPDVVRRVEAAGWESAPGSADDFRRYISDERARWEPVIRRSGARLD
ncbi:MAG: Bug family tripartite tricarboxylate transporter substrate binding protein [Betaproteobacteria bacterium]|jgi:tripartite-type tricarboxylate transporter receptor subunit TctC